MCDNENPCFIDLLRITNLNLNLKKKRTKNKQRALLSPLHLLTIKNNRPLPYTLETKLNCIYSLRLNTGGKVTVKFANHAMLEKQGKIKSVFMDVGGGDTARSAFSFNYSG